MSFLLITGRKSKVATAGRGTFFCPICHQQSDYALQRVSHYFTFFFVPLFPIKTVGHYVQCKSCGAELRSEVLELTREQIEDATAPWECAACGKANAATAQACRSCGAVRVPGPPPLPGGKPSLDPQTIIMSPSPFAGAQPAGSSSAVRVLLIVAGVVVLGIIGLIAFAIKSVHDARAHPELSGKKPGQVEFMKASSAILTSSGGVAHGNTPEATELAAALSKFLGTASKDIPHLGDADLLDPADGKFVTFCQLKKDACVFLVHVPNLRHYTDDSKQALAKLCYAAACVALKDGSVENIRKVAVASRGTLLYDRALLGAYPPAKDFGGTEKLETDGSTIAGLFPFFAPEASAEKSTPETTAAPSTPENPEPPATPTASTTPPPAATAAPLAATAPDVAPPARQRPALEPRSAPAWVPIYPDLPRPPHGSGREENGVIKGRANFETGDPLEKVKEFYENKLKADGFELTEVTPGGRLFEKAEITGRKNGGSQTLCAEIVQMKARTMVTLIYESPAGAENGPGKHP